MSITTSNCLEPLMLLPTQGPAAQLFVLLHGESASPEQLLPLAQAIRRAFPSSVVALPYGFVRGSAAAYRWSAHQGPEVGSDGQRMISDLAVRIKALQARYGLSAEQTALAGFSQGAAAALEAGLTQSGLAGRVLAFSGGYAALPDSAPQATTLHFFHGSGDALAPAEQVQKLHARIAELRGDATLDIASGVGHELHAALINQAVYRLQTCVPLRFWEAALGELDLRAEPPDGRTLH